MAKTSKGKQPKLERTYTPSPATFRQLLDRVRDVGRLSRETFDSLLGDESERKYFYEFVAELHYMRIVEDGDAVELVIDESERDLTTAIHAHLKRMRDWSNSRNAFSMVEFRMYQKTLQELYDLVWKASDVRD